MLTYSPALASATNPGTPGQVALDAAGYWYFCHGVNQWGRIGPTSYDSAAASPAVLVNKEESAATLEARFARKGKHSTRRVSSFGRLVAI